MSSSTTKVCFNSSCKEASENWRRGWRCRTGDYAHLCDRCASAYEEGKFCETFHSNASGWRCCESCGKQVHCGCIVSFHMFVLLDEGGIECLTCAKKSYVLTPNPAWPAPFHFLPSQSERVKDHSDKPWNAIASSGLVPWRQAPYLFGGFDIQSNVHPRIPFEIDASDGIDRYRTCERLSNTLPEMKQHSYETFVNGRLRHGPSESPQNGHAGLNMKELSNPFLDDFKPVFPKDNPSSNLSLVAASLSRMETDDTRFSAVLSQSAAISIPVGKRVGHIGMNSSGEAQTRNAKARGDGRGRNQLLSRYRPQITDKELHQISSNSKSVITPLFEKMLSASDAGRIGRLVLPKKCAETYFPPITHPEGLPLKVLDVKGKEWAFLFRFWPNNNSRMYVLEGITPCIQSMQLQAGDVVTFSRLEPEGNLVMGGRKASAILSSDQGDDITAIGSDASIPGDGDAKNKSGVVISVSGHMKEKILEDKLTIHSKRKISNFGAKSKRLRIENEDVIELKLTWKEAQGLMRPPTKIVPSFCVVEGCEFEEFEEAAPVIGRPTILGVDHFREKIQWVQCEDCLKWRKVPADALLPSRWICTENVWDLERSICSATEELSKDELDCMLPTLNEDSSRKEEITEQDGDLSVALEGLDALANLAIQGEGEGLPSSSENKTKHPRHKPGCTCIVCLQPPSGKGSKHMQSCDCVVCSSLKRRFRTLMERREKKQLGKEAEVLCQNLQLQQLPEKVRDFCTYPDTNNGSSSINREQEEVKKWGYHDEPNAGKSSTSPLKGQIDLNIQPEREEEPSPGSGSGHMKHLFPGCPERLFRQQRSLGSSDIVRDLVGRQMQQDGIGGATYLN